MYDPTKVECPRRTAHLKEPLCTKSITYGNVKDM
jgi:hypothetical protein